LPFEYSSLNKIPAIIFLHGSGGMYFDSSDPNSDLQTNFKSWREIATVNGYASLWIDSYSIRPSKH
jgi:hypothetical protein